MSREAIMQRVATLEKKLGIASQGNSRISLVAEIEQLEKRLAGCYMDDPAIVEPTLDDLEQELGMNDEESVKASLADPSGTYTKVAKDMTAGYTADALFDAIVMDSWPSSSGPLVDFGLDGADSQKKYEALYGPIREGEITKMDLRKVVGDGPAITKLVNRCRSNPHRGIKFTTVYDGMKASLADPSGIEEEITQDRFTEVEGERHGEELASAASALAVGEESPTKPSGAGYVARLMKASERLDKVAEYLEKNGRRALALKVDKIADAVDARVNIIKGRK